ncbi:hypothetical protein OBBRIDRAFT_749611 [Obba rivulosa]|uniref:Signal recognition particle receptor subunit beta n=1 Tax=Obba rivulosa TaxID=1052685 RepID=A0A8E2J2N5_9APHY|nr:hypothetical protein OBBRIDRAFT_749611 [Obba rivulosa]
MDDVPQPDVTPEVLVPASIFTPQTLLLTSLAFASALLLLFVLFARRKSVSKGDALLLVGPPDAGKTTILSTLAYKQTLSTHTSMQTNSSIVALPSSSQAFRVIDIPGHPRIRDQFEEHLENARTVAFVVDASTVSRVGPAVAEHLHQIMHALTSLPPSRRTPTLTILAHKYDLLKPTAHARSDELAVSRVRTVLERELEKRRASHAGGVGVESLGEEGGESEIGGLECTGGGEFRFAEWEGGEVTFVGTSVPLNAKLVVDEKSEEVDGLSAFRRWLEEEFQ